MDKIFKRFNFIVAWGMIIINGLPLLLSLDMVFTRKVFMVFYAIATLAYGVFLVREMVGEKDKNIIMTSFTGFAVMLILTFTNARPYPFADYIQ